MRANAQRLQTSGQRPSRDRPLIKILRRLSTVLSIYHDPTACQSMRGSRFDGFGRTGLLSGVSLWGQSPQRNKCTFMCGGM